jgi:hypothetical protein
MQNAVVVFTSAVGSFGFQGRNIRQKGLEVICPGKSSKKSSVDHKRY